MRPDEGQNGINSIDDYKVGFKNPPRHTQFKKGVSGNLKGRPKGSKNKPKVKPEPLPPAQKTVPIPRHKLIRYDQFFPRPEHCTFDDAAKRVTIFGPISASEEREWMDIEKRQRNLKDDIIWLWEEIGQCEDAYIEAQLRESLCHTHTLIADDLKRKEKFRRSMSYEEFRIFKKKQRRN